MDRDKELAVLKTDVFCNNEFEDEIPFYAEVLVTRRFVERVLQLSRAIQELEVYSIDDDGTGYVTYYADEEGKEVLNLECDEMVVESNGIYFEGFVKNSENSKITTQVIEIKVIEDLHKVDRTPIKELPLLMGEDLVPEAEDLMKQRFEE